MHFSPTGSNRSITGGRPKLLHQSSLPTNPSHCVTESTFIQKDADHQDGAVAGGTSSIGAHRAHATSNGKHFRHPGQLFDVHKTIEEASDELKSSSFDQNSTLLPANGNGSSGSKSPINGIGGKLNGKTPEDGSAKVPLETTSLLHPEVDVERLEGQKI